MRQATHPPLTTIPPIRRASLMTLRAFLMASLSQKAKTPGITKRHCSTLNIFATVNFWLARLSARWLPVM